jgi:hypothetical protein
MLAVMAPFSLPSSARGGWSQLLDPGCFPRRGGVIIFILCLPILIDIIGGEGGADPLSIEAWK